MGVRKIVIAIITTIICVLVIESKAEEKSLYTWTSPDVDYNEICKTQTCVPKCCPKGQYLFGYIHKCRPSKKIHKDFSEVPVYYKNHTTSGKHLSDIILVPGRVADQDFNETSYDYSSLRHNFYAVEDGMLHIEVPNTYNRWTYLNATNYCVDYILPMRVKGMKEAELRFLVRTASTTVGQDNPLMTAGMLLSCFFLLVVFIVYAILKELRNLSGCVLMAYVASLFGGFLLLVVLQLDRYDPHICNLLSYFTYFLLLSSFCWMNIMSCDIWWTFRGYAKARPIHRRGENFKFCMYCIYAWGLPAAMTCMLIVLNEINMRHIPWFVTPNIVLRGCFLREEEKFFYLYIPMLILIVCNWVFFLMTAFNIWRLHRATAVLDSAAAGTPAAHRTQKYRFLVYLKLSVIMGINWVLEVVSSFSPDFKGWYITDVYNMMIGLSIFLIFVCKRQILKKLIKRFRECDKLHSGSRYSRSRSRSSNTTDSDVSADTPCICPNPKGPFITITHPDKR